MTVDGEVGWSLGDVRGLGGVITFRKCDSPQVGVNYVRNVCHLMKRCDAHGRCVSEFEDV